jgi:hypothetical protein
MHVLSYSGLGMVWARMGWAVHCLGMVWPGNACAGLDVFSAGHRPSGRGLACAWARLGMVWALCGMFMRLACFGHGLGW